MFLKFLFDRIRLMVTKEIELLKQKKIVSQLIS